MGAKASGSFVAIVAAATCVSTILVGCGGGGSSPPSPPSPPTPPPTPAPPPKPAYKARCEWSPDNNTDVKLEILSCDERTFLQSDITTVTADPVPLSGGTCKAMMESFLHHDCKPKG